jgi:transposase InsO family protein
MRQGFEKLGLSHQTTTQSQRMNIHTNARLTPRSREALVLAIINRRLTAKAAAAAFAVSERTVRKWIARFRAEGMAGLDDRSSRPRRSPRQIPPAQIAVVLSLRRLRMPGFQIARQCALSKASVSRILRRHQLHRLALLDPPPPARRYQRAHPGELIHLDIKKLARIERPSHRVTGDRRDLCKGAGWEYVHVAIDDASRIAFARIMPDETKHSAIAFLQSAADYFRALGIEPQAIMSDNGACYVSKLFAQSRQALGLRHLFTRPYTPRTNGKAERFIQTSLREWAYARTYQHSTVRATYLPTFLHHYNWHRTHSALDHHPPISKLNLTMNNLLRLHS